MNEWLPDRLETLKNLTETALILLEHGTEPQVISILELMYYYTQEMILADCIKEGRAT